MEGQIDPLTRTVGLVARVPAPYDRIPGSDRPPLVVGLFVEAEILGRVVRDIAVLPRSALRGTDRVLVIDDEDRLHFRTVEVLRAEVTRVLVQNGLEEGERVCLSPLDAVVEGMKIRVSGSAEQGVGKAATKPGLARVGHGTGGLE